MVKIPDIKVGPPLAKETWPGGGVGWFCADRNNAVVCDTKRLLSALSREPWRGRGLGISVFYNKRNLVTAGGKKKTNYALSLSVRPSFLTCEGSVSGAWVA